MWDTRRERIADRLSWFPTKITLHLATSDYLILAGIAEIIQALCRPTQPNSLLPHTPQHLGALEQLTTILSRLASKPQTPSTPTAAAPLRVGNTGAPLRGAYHAHVAHPCSPRRTSRTPGTTHRTYTYSHRRRSLPKACSPPTAHSRPCADRHLRQSHRYHRPAAPLPSSPASGRQHNPRSHRTPPRLQRLHLQSRHRHRQRVVPVTALCTPR
jgi:hypothetical protein